MVLLIRQCFDRCRVETATTGFHCHLESVFGDHRLARTCRSRNEHRLSGVERIEGLHLKRVGRKVVAREPTCPSVTLSRICCGHAAAVFDRRQSTRAPMPTAMRYKIVSGIPRANSVNGSPLGVMTAATTKMITIA